MKLHKIEPSRYILFFGKPWSDDPQLRIEVSRAYNFGLGFKISRGKERDLQLSVHAWKLFSIFLTYEGKPFQYRNDDEVDIIGFSWQTNNHVIHAQLMDYSGMDSSKPAKVNWYWNYRDWLFGSRIYSESSHGKSYHLKHIKVQFPEGEYDLAMDFYTSYWHRPRSPFTLAVERVEVVPDRPVGIPGKGENSYDQDEDATFSSMMPVNGRTIEQIAGDFIEDILKTRQKRASRDWKPEKKWQQPTK